MLYNENKKEYVYMTNRNRKRMEQGRNKKKQAQANESNEEVVRVQLIEERKNKMTIAELATSVISVAALVVSILAFWNQSQYTELEYRYKLEPEIEVQGNMEMSMQLDEAGKNINLSDRGNKIQISQKNNLHSAYIIHSDYEMEKLEFNKEENTLETTEGVDFNEPNMIVNGVSYHYEFLFLEGLDGSYKLYLLYMRSGRVMNEFGFYKLSGVEILELEKAHIEQEDYAGEKELAKKYLEVLEECQKYIIQ